MSCPYLDEAVMVFCRAYPVKKMVPRSRVVSASPCGGDYQSCPLFREITARLRALADRENAGALAGPAPEKEGPA